MFAATHDPVRSSGNPLCHPLHWSIVARKSPIKMDHGDPVQLGRWAGQGFRPQKSHGFRASTNLYKNLMERSRGSARTGWSGWSFHELETWKRFVDLHEAFPASHVSVPEGMIQHVRLKHNSFRLMTFHSCKSNSLDFEASRSGPGKMFFSTENCH